MIVRITFRDGKTVVGELLGDEPAALKSKTLDWVLNDDRKFLPFRQPNGKKVQLLKNSIAMIMEEDEWK